MNLQSTFLFLAQRQWIMSILWKACKADNFQSHNSLKVNITNIWSLHSNFVDSESLLEWNSPDIIALCETNQDHSMGSGNFSVRGYLRLIRRDSCIHIHGITVYVKEGLHFEQDVFQENSPESYLCFRMALLHSVSNFFFLFRSLSLSLCTVFDSFSSNINENILINPSANVFIFGAFNIQYNE